MAEARSELRATGLPSFAHSAPDKGHKDFPPGWGLLKIPTSSRRAALAGLSLYAPCRQRAVWAHEVAWRLVATFGPGALPGRAKPWTPPVDRDVWAELMERLRSELGVFDTVAALNREAPASGLSLLPMLGGSPLAFVKLREGDDAPLRNEFDALERLSGFHLRFFSVPEPLAIGTVRGWHYLLVKPLPPCRHRAPRHPPLNLILREVQAALADLPRPADTPSHWRPMHGDFTPWNLRQLPGRGLVLMDWEDAGWGPPGADRVLYRATAAEVDGYLTATSFDREAVTFWMGHVKSRSVSVDRDRRLKVSLVDTLQGMLPAEGRPSSPTRPRVLVIAYAGEPWMGSEPGAGWGLIRAVSEFADCVVLVAPEHIASIRRWELEQASRSVSFVEVGESRIAAYAKWHRIPWFLLYMAWLRRAYRVGRQLHDARPFDAAYHATYSTYWLPTPIARFGIPAVWGPVGGAARTPLRLWPLLGWPGVLDEVLDLVSVRLAALWPATRRTWRSVAGRLVQNEETLAQLPKRIRAQTHLLNHTILIEVPDIGPRPRGSEILYVSPLEARKGARLAIRALAYTPEDVHLNIVGDGPDRGALGRLARRLRVLHRVRFLGFVPRERVFDLLAEAAAVVFTGLREEGGVALTEAMLCGAPVIVLANGGARTVASAATDPSRVVLVQPGSVAETARRFGGAMTHFSRNPPLQTGPTLDQAAARRVLRSVFEEALARSG